jgi:hypothetical protein
MKNTVESPFCRLEQVEDKISELEDKTDEKTEEHLDRTYKSYKRNSQ